MWSIHFSSLLLPLFPLATLPTCSVLWSPSLFLPEGFYTCPPPPRTFFLYFSTQFLCLIYLSLCCTKITPSERTLKVDTAPCYALPPPYPPPVMLYPCLILCFLHNSYYYHALLPPFCFIELFPYLLPVFLALELNFLMSRAMAALFGGGIHWA